MNVVDETNKESTASRLEEILKKDGRLVYRGTGTSMMPLIRRGIDLVDIRAGKQARPYDIVLYRRRGSAGGAETTKYILHRVLSDEGDHYLILGDNCISTERVAKEDVLGTMEVLLRGGRPVKMDGLAHSLYLKLWVRPWKMRTRLLRAKAGLRRGVAAILPEGIKKKIKSAKKK